MELKPRLGYPTSDWVDNGISLDIISLDDLLDEVPNPVFLDDIAFEFDTSKTIENINEIIRLNYDSDELNTVPSCRCGETYGAVNYDPVNPVICEDCGHPVIDKINDPLYAELWMRPPEGIEAMVQPRIYDILSSNYRNQKFDLFEYLLNPTYSPGSSSKLYYGGTEEIDYLVKYIKECGIERGLNYFVLNFDYVIQCIFIDNPRCLAYKYKAIKYRERIVDKTLQFIGKYRDRIFCSALPFPSRLIMISETGGTAEFIDPNITDAFDAPKTLASLLTRPKRPSNKVLQAETLKVIKLMVGYFNNYYSKTLTKKTGMARGQMGSTRGSYTGRAVIAPLAMNHEYDEIHTPWSWSVGIMSVQLENKLLLRGYSPVEIMAIIDRGYSVIDPLLRECFDEILEECPEGGFPVSMLRNPTLTRGSNQYFRITKIHDDINNNAIMMSVLAIKAQNADFDGDQEQVKLLIDNKEREQFIRLAAHNNFMDTTVPNSISRFITFHAEVIAMMNNFLDHHREEAGVEHGNH